MRFRLTPKTVLRITANNCLARRNARFSHRRWITPNLRDLRNAQLIAFVCFREEKGVDSFFIFSSDRGKGLVWMTDPADSINEHSWACSGIRRGPN
jgi:hypothetical protein